jgi:mono/diheme cytochrome c family protein
MRLLPFAALLLLAVFTSFGEGLAQPPVAGITLSWEGGKRAVPFAELSKKIPSVVMELEDFTYRVKKKFRGFPVRAIVQSFAPRGVTYDEIIFVASDGFEAPIPSKEFTRHEAILAFQEEGRADRWETFLHGKELTDPGPYYLVWKEGRVISQDSRWPYKVVRLDFSVATLKYRGLAPSGAGADVVKGFDLFKSNCIQCHSMNLQGGTIGPELNAPKNVVEYWSPEHLRAFIKNSSSYRYRSKMPSFAHFSEADLDALVAYLSWMKDRKIQQP